MPYYVYVCRKRHITEVKQKFDDEPLAKCPECGATCHRVPQLTNWIPKTSGFYRTDKVLSDKKGSDE